MVRDENILRQYLLGVLGEQEQLALEQKLLLDEDEFEQLLIAEDELTDAYARNALAPPERERFEQHFLSTLERQQKLRFAQAFHRHIDRATEQAGLTEQAAPSQSGWLLWFNNFLRASHPVRGYALTAACALIVLGGPWLAFKVIRLQNEVTQMRAQSSAPQPTEQELRQRLAESRASNAQLGRALQNSQAQVAQLERSLAQAPQTTQRPAPPANASVIAFVLTPGALARDASAPNAINQVTIPAGARTAQLQLELEKDQYPNYRALLYTQGGAVLRRWEEVQPQQTQDGKRLLLPLPTTLLPTGSYYFRLEGITADGRADKADQFHFHVTRK